MIPFSSKVSAQIGFLLEGLDDSNSDSVFKELCKFASHGIEGSILLLQICFDHLNIYGNDMKNMQLHPVYSSIFRHIMDKPYFSAVLSESLNSSAINEEFMQNFSDALHLSAPEKIGIGLALSDSQNLDVRMCGNNLCMSQIAELCANPIPFESTDLRIQQILDFLNHSEGLTEHVDSFMQMLSLLKLKEGDQFILSPFLSDGLREESFFRHSDLFSEDDFDTILAEMESENSMADVMRELGYGCTVNISECKELLSLFLPLSDVKIAKILGTITQTYGNATDENQNGFATFRAAIGGNSGATDQPELNSWNVDVLADSIKQLAPGVNWMNVMEKMDHEGFYIPNEAAFSFFMSVYRHVCQEPFPLRAICGSIWKNSEGQLSFLKFAVSMPPEVFTFAHSERQLGYKFQLGQVINPTWLCLDLLEVLCELAETGHASSVRAILENPLNQCPEVLLLGMAHVNTTYNLIQYEVSSAVLPMVLKTASGNSLILHLWHVNEHMLLRGLIDAINYDHDNVNRFLDAFQDLKILSPLLDKVPFHFGIRLADLASRKELIDLENWLTDNLATHKEAFYEECLVFLKEVRAGSQDASTNRFHPTGALVNTYSDAYNSILKALQSHAAVISSSHHLSEEMEKLHITSSVHTNTRSESASSENYSADIEREANSYFHQMFSGMDMDAMIQMLAQFKESMEEREQKIFDCMIANLFEEYKFFSKYPEKQLKTAAVLFGSLIKHQLVTHLTLGLALRAVLDALRKPADSKMFVFGTNALEQFVDRLIEWPQYCNHILQISHLRATHGELVAFIERELARISAAHAEPGVVHNPITEHHHGRIQSSVDSLEISGSSLSMLGLGSSQMGPQVSTPIQLPQRPLSSTKLNSSTVAPSTDTVAIPKLQSAVSAPVMNSSSTGFPRTSRATSARFGSALNIETLVAAAERRETPIEAPGSEVQDKISFIINNLSAANIEAKSKEFTEILNEQYYPWFAQYLVMKRASIEPNFHDLYLKFLDKVNLKPLNKEVLQATYENCKVLLGSELIKSSSEERSLLKNLGSWLGKITIGKNQVLRAREIDPKSLIIEAYEKGLMIAVIPFTSKTLEPCSTSLAYQPPNPWTMGILGLLAEIYAMPNLKMNLKFDIEVLFKNLGVEFSKVKATTLLEGRVREVEGNPDFSNKDAVGPSQPQIVNEAKPGIISTVNQVEVPIEVSPPPPPPGPQSRITQYAAPVHLPVGTLTEEEKMLSLALSDQIPPSHFSATQLPVPASGIEQEVVINKKLHTLGLHVHFQSVLPIVMDRAIKEIVSSIVQRSVSIATQTTKELVLKDYTMELDETLVRNAAHLMVGRLAGSLAHVTCKEPLRGSISSQLRSSLQGLSTSSDLIEQAVQLVTNDNLDLGCAVIEKAATEKSIQTIDGELGQQLTIRRKHREVVGPTYFDSNLYAHGHMGALPEALRPKPGRLSHMQQSVYEDFARLPWQNRPSQNLNSVPLGSSTSSASGGLSRQFATPSNQISQEIYSSGIVNIATSPVPQNLEIAYEDIDTNAAQIQSDATSPQSLENDASVSTFPLSSTPESELSNAVTKEPAAAGPAAQPITGTLAATEPLLTTGDALDKYQTISEKLDNLLIVDAKDTEIQGVISEVPAVILRCISRDEAALAVAQKAFKGLYENASNSDHVNAHLAILAAIRDVSKLVVKELTSWVMYSEEDRKFNKDITIGLICSDLLNLAEYNVHMAKLLDAGRNKAATEFTISLIQTLVINDSKVISELQNLVDALAKLASRPGSPDSLVQLVEIAKNPAGSIPALSTVGKEDNMRSSRDKKVTGAIREDYTASAELVEPDPAAFHEQVSVLFAEWYQICELPGVNDVACARYVIHLHQRGMIKGDDTSDYFFRRLMELSVSHCLSSEVINSTPAQSHQAQPLSFLAIDIYAKLVFSVLKFYPSDQGSSKLSLLPKVLAVTVKFIQKDAEEKRASFNPRPYFRLFINWLTDLCTLEPVFDGTNFQVLTALANAFHAIQPLKIAGFSFAWLELVSHRSFMPKLLTANAQKGWPYFQRLLLDLFQFMEPFLRNAELGEPVHFLYKGTLRVLLVLLHDFPEFLCDYHFSFCDVIPPSCIQMRNIVLSAFPRNMRLPDPSTPNLKIDLLAEISQSPRILSEVDAALKAMQMKNDVDEYLKTRQQGSSFLGDLKHKLVLSPSDAVRAGTRYNVPLINSLVLYVGMQAIHQLQSRSPQHSPSLSSSMTAFLVSAALDIFQALIMELDTEGRYLFLNAIGNQLRYPNNHTHYFSFILLYLFAESNQETIQEQITRVLLERLIVNRPHPWGLLITFIELIKNPRYNFWSRSFTRCAPEIEKLFESVSRSCGGPKPVDDGVGSAVGIPENMH